MVNQMIIISNQVFVMFILIILGYILYKRQIINDEGAKQISNLLMKIVAPFTIMSAFMREFDKELAYLLLMSIILAVIAYGISIAYACIFCKKGIEDYADRRMCLIFPNNGFMALPLLSALYGPIGVFLGSAHIVISNIILWTYGMTMLKGGKSKISIKTICF